MPRSELQAGGLNVRIMIGSLSQSHEVKGTLSWTNRTKSLPNSTCYRK